jgi:TRAP-type C4-dicarboxylate transport system permease small subunit
MSGIWGKANAVIDGLARLGGCLGQLVLVFMVATICYDVIMRYVFVAPTYWSLEVNTFLIVFLALIPAAEALRSDAHLKITFFVDRMPERIRQAIQAVTCLLGAGFCAIMAWKGGYMAADAYFYGERMSTPLGTPMVIPYLFIPAGFALLGLQFLVRLRAKVAEQAGPHEAQPEL